MSSFFASYLRRSLMVLSLWIPLLASAQVMPVSHWTAMVSGRLLATGNLISLTASTAFPSEIAASSSAAAVYTVTNIGTIPLTGISTQLVAPSAFSISSATCSETSPLAVGDSCTINLTMQAPSDATALSGTLQERALPTLDGVKADFSVHVNAPLTVMSNAGSNGSVSPASQTVSYGSSATFNATPSTGYTVNQWSINGTVVQTGGSSYILSDVTASQTVSVSFTPIIYTVTATADSNGSINPSGAISVSFGSSLSFTASPNTGYSINEWRINGSVVQTGGSSYTLSDVTMSQALSVTFTPLTYVVTSASTDDTQGNVGPASRTVDYGASATFIAVPSTDYSVNQWLVDGVLAQTGGTSYTLTDITATHEVTVSFYVPLMIAVGSGISGPKLVQSLDKGVTWAEKTIAGADISGGGVLYDTVCTGTESTAVCTAVGQGSDGVFSSPLLVVSRDNGGTWNAATTSLYNIANDGTQFNTASCTGSDDTAFCLAAGGKSSAPFITPPILVKSIDSGQNWSSVSIPGITIEGTLTDSSCTGTGANNVCAIIGKDVAAGRPLLVVGTVDGTSWSVAADITAFTNVTLNTTSCTGSGSSAVCVAAGKDSSAPFIALSIDGGITWSRQTISGLPAVGEFKASSCTGNGTDVICSVAGIDGDNSKAMLWVLNTSSGVAWTKPTLIGDSGFTLTTTSCTGSGSAALCVAAGQDTSNAPLLIQSTDGGSVWTSFSITGGTPSLVNLLGSHCSVNQAMCTVVGDPTSLLLQTVTAGDVWSQDTTLGSGTLYASGGT